MKLTKIKHADIDFVKWDKAILSSKMPFVFAQSFYLNATSPNWEALIMGDYETVFPLTVKSKYGFSYLPQPPFTLQLGVFGKIDLETEQLFYNYVTAHYKLIDLELNASNQLKNENIVAKNTYIINYSDDFKINQNTKRNIAKAKTLGLMVKKIKDNHLQLSQQYITPFLNTQVGLSLNTISVLDDLLINANKYQQLISFKVIDKDNNMKAMAHFISNGKHTVYLKGASIDKNDHTGSMHLLLSHALDYFKDKSQWFDFGGGNKNGIANFYLGFGAQVQEYGFLQTNTLPFFIKWFK